MRLPFLDAFSRNKSTATPSPSPRKTEPSTDREDAITRSRRHGHSRSMQSPRIEVNLAEPTVEGNTFMGVHMKPSMDLWLARHPTGHWALPIGSWWPTGRRCPTCPGTTF